MKTVLKKRKGNHATTMSSTNNDTKYCWCNADPTQVEYNPIVPRPSPREALLHADDSSANREAAFPHRLWTDISHKDYNGMIRQRGLYWWFSEQLKLEDKIKAGTLHPSIGEFYVFLEDEHTPGYTILGKPLPGTDTSKPPTTVLFRYGNVFAYNSKIGYYWGVQSVAVPKGHPDANLPPYQMIDVIDRSH